MDKKNVDLNVQNELAAHYKGILSLLGEDAEREGLIKTPERVAKAMQTLTRGYHEDPAAILNSAKFKENYNQMVIVKDIDFFSLCEHHMLPFYGKVHVAYIPNGYITGLSKIARVVDCFSHRLQVQAPSRHLARPQPTTPKRPRPPRDRRTRHTATAPKGQAAHKIEPAQRIPPPQREWPIAARPPAPVPSAAHRRPR